MRILVLTKNVSYELELQKELQIFNHEVFVTKNELEDELLFEGAALFDFLFISELIAEKEFMDIYQELAPVYKGRIVRILSENELFATETTEADKDKPEVAYVSRSFVNLRDFLVTIVESTKLSVQLYSKEEFDKFLSKKEQILFRNLNDSEIISREELCWKIWGIKKTSSKKAQLSNLVKRINKKLEEYNFTDKRIKTYWGKGYILQ